MTERKREKKYCGTCGLPLVRVVTTISYDEYTGDRQEWAEMQCPNQKRHVDAIMKDLGL